jgi:hypothetical protein
MTGESIVSKCQKARKSLEKSLVQIQDIVPVMLAAEVSQVYCIRYDFVICFLFVIDLFVKYIYIWSFI